ncbi:MAG: mandelate racemase/muconate lactonizing enzyme family protein [Geminicoccaceae bacterium]|nr:mandelate racemase/muconate lactonizing enzyme family protein [Geminicoccaceae bacterium]
MRIARIEDLHCDAGWRTWSFLKITTDDGVVGWSEYNESYGSRGLTAVIRKLAEHLDGLDPRPVERITAMLYAMTRQAPGGLIQQAIAAIENALVDVKARALGVPVAEMLGGPVRERLRLYWSHCGSYRLDHSETTGTSPLRSLSDVRALGAEVRERGFSALKTNIFCFDRGAPYMHMPGFGRVDGWPELNVDRRLLGIIDRQMAAFRDGAGNEVDLLLDLNFNFKTEGYLQVARAIEPYELMWLEIDLFDPAALALIRSRSRTPIASCESLFGRRQFRPYLDAQAVDVAIIDIPWNGILEGMKIAAMAEAYEVNCAPHNFYGNLSTMMSAHFCAAIPNFRIMEIDIDDVPWKDEVVSPPEIDDGHLVLGGAPGWGVEVNEDAIRAHPPKG